MWSCCLEDGVLTFLQSRTLAFNESIPTISFSRGMGSSQEENNEERVISTKERMPPFGISVFWLKTGFIEELVTSGKDKTTRLYEIENLNRANGFRRQNTIITSTGQDIGISYVDSLEGDDKVGRANVVLSCGRANMIEDVVDTLTTYCSENILDEKRTYVWISCLCLNQYRTLTNRDPGKLGSFDLLKNILQKNMLCINKVVALISLQEKSLYLSRVWCIFELYTAYVNQCKLTIVMSQREEDVLTSACAKGDRNFINEILFSLSTTEIERADACVDDHKRCILKEIEDGPGFLKFNKIIHMQLQRWIKERLVQSVLILQQRRDDDSSDKFITACNFVGIVLNSLGEFDLALKYHQNVIENEHNVDHDRTLIETSYIDMGLANYRKGEWNAAMKYYKKGLHIQKKCLEHIMPDINTPCKGAGGGELYSSILLYKKKIAESRSNIGEMYRNKGELDQALKWHTEALRLQEDLFGKDHRDATKFLVNIGLVLNDLGDLNGALEFYMKALGIQDQVLEENHLDKVIVYSNIAQVYLKQMEFDVALEFVRKGVEIQKKLCGQNHPDIAASYVNMGIIHLQKREFGVALECYNKALAIQSKVLSRDHHDMALLYHNIAVVHFQNAEIGSWQEYTRKASSIFRLRPTHPTSLAVFDSFPDWYQ